jgi:glycine cleavage system H protein
MDVEGYNMPEDLYYEKDHYWVKEDGDLLRMGMDDFAQRLAGKIVFVQLPEPGKALEAGKRFAKVESGKWLGKINAPVSGELAEVNEALEDNPGLINEDCYGAGWMYKIRPDNKADVANLIHGAEAIRAWLVADIAQFVQK